MSTPAEAVMVMINIQVMGQSDRVPNFHAVLLVIGSAAAALVWTKLYLSQAAPDVPTRYRRHSRSSFELNRMNLNVNPD